MTVYIVTIIFIFYMVISLFRKELPVGVFVFKNRLAVILSVLYIILLLINPLWTGGDFKIVEFIFLSACSLLLSFLLYKIISFISPISVYEKDKKQILPFVVAIPWGIAVPIVVMACLHLFWSSLVFSGV